MRKLCRVIALSLHVVQFASAQSGWLKPPEALLLDGVPQIPASIGASIHNYQPTYDDVLVGWDPTKVEPIFVRRYSTGAWVLSKSANPGEPPSQFRQLPARVYEAYSNPRRRYFVFQADASAGAERMQFYGYDGEQSSLVLLTDGTSKNYYPLFSKSGDRMMYSSTRRTGKHMDIYVTNPLDPKSNRMVALLEGEDWSAFDWSLDDNKVVLSENRRSGETYLWLLDVASGTKSRLTDVPALGTVFNGSSASFNKDGTGIYHVTDRDSEFRRLAYLDIATRRETYLSGYIGADVEEFALSPNGGLLAFTCNENGFSRLHIIDTSKKNQEIQLPEMPTGVIHKLSWHSSGSDLAFGLSSGTVPGDIYSVQMRHRILQQWTSSGRAEMAELPKPELVKWRSFDGKSIPGFLYRPPARFTGRRPVIINVHGGPSSQFRPGFREVDNYFTFELGLVMIYPNIRGSTGYGKSYAEADNGYRREDAIKDIGALLNWIRTQSELDADHVVIKGESYGGYVALSVAANYSAGIVGAISDSGPSNLATDLERTDVSRQDRRRAEYGDERDAEMKKFLETIAPFRRADKVRKPLLVIQGKNDSRVPYTESEQMVVAVRKTQTPVWYLLALNEGHSFTSVRIVRFSLCAQAFFISSLLAGQLVSR